VPQLQLALQAVLMRALLLKLLTRQLARRPLHKVLLPMPPLVVLR
jgi:hypothetical protein